MNQIPLAHLTEMFERMREEYGWNTERPLLWGYFFTNPDEAGLRSLADYLVRHGYRFVDIFPTDDDSTMFLHVEKLETHTPQSLQGRNAEFYALAAEFGVESYDGMDAGPVERDPRHRM